MGMKLPEHTPSTYMQKPFSFEELPRKWKEFCVLFRPVKGKPWLRFFNTVEQVSIEGDTLFLPTSSTFYQAWILEPSNRLSLKNIISFYTDAPPSLRLEVRLAEGTENRKDTEEKSGERYSHLNDTK